jgi:hypothetical protein
VKSYVLGWAARMSRGFSASTPSTTRAIPKAVHPDRHLFRLFITYSFLTEVSKAQPSR